MSPVKYVGIIPTSDKTEYLPPTYKLCSINSKFNFLAKENNVLFFFSEIIITFFEFFLIMSKKNALDKVSIVLPDFDIIINKILDKSSFFLKLINLLSSRLLKKKNFFIQFSF